MREKTDLEGVKFVAKQLVILVRHGEDMVEVERSFEGIRKYLEEHNIEGLVFWFNGEPACKIKRSDFGYSWPMK